MNEKNIQYARGVLAERVRIRTKIIEKIERLERTYQREGMSWSSRGEVHHEILSLKSALWIVENPEGS